MPTALDLTPEQLEQYRQAARRRAALPALTAAERREREALLQRVAEAAALLKSQFGARRVILIGSLAHRGWFAADSDVDLVVEGLQGDYWQAWRRVEEAIGNRQVDFIELEIASDALKRVVQRYGVDL